MVPPAGLEEYFYMKAPIAARVIRPTFHALGRKAMCEGYWDARMRRWVRLEELEEREHETPLADGVAIPPITLVEPRRKAGLLLR